MSHAHLPVEVPPAKYKRSARVSPPDSLAAMALPSGRSRPGRTVVSCLGLLSVAIAATPARAQYPVNPTPVISTGSLTPDPRLGGYISLRETVRDDTMTFTLHRARIGVQALPAPFVALRLQADLAALGRTSGDTIPGILITDAFVQLAPTDTAHPMVRMLRPAMLVGQFRTPFALENLTSTSAVITASRSMAADRLALKRDRGFFGQVRFPRLLTLNAAVVDGEGQNRTSNPDGRQFVVTRGTLMPLANLSVSGKWAAQGSDRRWGYDARWLPGAGVLEGELVEREGPTNATTTTDARAGYVLAAYKVLPWLQPLVKWEQLHETLSTATTTAHARATWTTIGVNLIATDERFRAQFNWVDRSERPVDRKGELVIQLQAMF